MGEEMSEAGGFIVIGERINATRKPIRAAIKKRDAEFIKNEARAQAAAGAHYIDVNAGASPATEADDLKWLVEVVQSAVELPLCLDSPSPAVLKGALSLVEKKPIINSITAESQKIAAILPLVVEYETSVVGLCVSESGMPEGIEQRIAAVETMVKEIEAAGLPLARVYFDPAICPVSTSPSESLAAIEAVRRIKSLFEGARTTCGLSNISFGLPNRNVLNRTYLAMLMSAGLDSAIMDPTEPGMATLVVTGDVLMARDEFCMRYIQAAREGKLN